MKSQTLQFDVVTDGFRLKLMFALAAAVDFANPYGRLSVASTGPTRLSSSSCCFLPLDCAILAQIFRMCWSASSSSISWTQRRTAGSPLSAQILSLVALYVFRSSFEFEPSTPLWSPHWFVQRPVAGIPPYHLRRAFHHLRLRRPGLSVSTHTAARNYLQRLTEMQFQLVGVESLLFDRLVEITEEAESGSNVSVFVFSRRVLESYSFSLYQDSMLRGLCHGKVVSSLTVMP